MLDVTGAASASLPIAMSDSFSFSGVPAGHLYLRRACLQRHGPERTVKRGHADVPGILRGTVDPNGFFSVEGWEYRFRGVVAGAERGSPDRLHLDGDRHLQHQCADCRPIAVVPCGPRNLHVPSSGDECLWYERANGGPDHHDSVTATARDGVARRSVERLERGRKVRPRRPAATPAQAIESRRLEPRQ